MEDSGSNVPVAQAKALIEEILRSRGMTHEKKGHQMRRVLEYLLELFQRDPEKRSSEKELTGMLYLSESISEDAAKKVVIRLRRFLNAWCDRLPPSRVLRVQIPENDYRLVFYEKLKRYDEDPVSWFWSAYLDGSLPLKVAFLHPGVRWHHKGFSPHATVRLYRSLLKVTGEKLPEPISLRHVGASSQLAEAQHKIIFAAAPHMDTVSSQYWYYREDLKMLHWAPPRDLSDGIRKPERIAIVDPQPIDPQPLNGAHPRAYEDDGQTAHVLVTRFTFPKAPHPQLTIVSACEPRAIEKVMDTLTDSQLLFRVVTSGVFEKDSWERSRAPAIFQIVFAVPHRPVWLNSVFKDSWSSPTMRLAAVFAGPVRGGETVGLQHGHGEKSFHPDESMGKSG